MIEAPDDDAPHDRSILSRLRGDEPPSYWLTRFVILRLLGLVYFVAFLTLVNQGQPLIGRDGLTPAGLYLERLQEHFGSRLDAFLQVPSIFWLDVSDTFLLAVAWTGVLLSLAVLLGWANSLMLGVLWALYLSVDHVGQTWYSFGWEIQLLETGFLAVFLVPLLDARPFPRRPPPVVVIWLYRWLIFRILLGAGLIKVRGDSCWRDLTCLAYHYETQPVPNPLSRVLHFMPLWFHKLGVLFNHLVELVVPCLGFGPRRIRHVAGTLMVAFQVMLILSGNLSFLNWLTIVPALACFDDSLLARLLPRPLVRRAEAAAESAEPSPGGRAAVAVLAVVVALLSVAPIRNLVSPHQAMNTSFDRLHLVNTYGAFGSVGRERFEIVLEGTRDERPSDEARWQAYEFKCKPGDPERRPCVITPYHYRLDWLMWFAAMSSPERYPWTVHLVWKLLHDDPGALSLLASNPFPEEPPRYVRARLFRYEFAPFDDPASAWWRRSEVGPWLPPLSVDDPRLLSFLDAYGWRSGQD